MTYTFTVAAAEVVQGQHNYGLTAPAVTEPLSVQYLATDPRTNRPSGYNNWIAFEVALVFAIAVAVMAFGLYLDREWYFPWKRYGSLLDRRSLLPLKTAAGNCKLLYRECEVGTL